MLGLARGPGGRSGRHGGGHAAREGGYWRRRRELVQAAHGRGGREAGGDRDAPRQVRGGQSRALVGAPQPERRGGTHCRLAENGQRCASGLSGLGVQQQVASTKAHGIKTTFNGNSAGPLKL